MGELQLEILVDRLLREFKVQGNVGKPQVAYRETITKKVSVETKFVRQTGGRGQYAHVLMEFGPSEKGEGYVFENKIFGGAIPREFINPVKAGIKGALGNGVIAGYPLVDIKATQDIFAVVNNGELFERAELDAMLATAAKQKLRLDAQRAEGKANL